MAKTQQNPEIKLPAKTPEPPPEIKATPQAEPSEQVIKEIMVQKGVTRERAIEILKNPSK